MSRKMPPMPPVDSFVMGHSRSFYQTCCSSSSILRAWGMFAPCVLDPSPFISSTIRIMFRKFCRTEKNSINTRFNSRHSAIYRLSILFLRTATIGKSSGNWCSLRFIVSALTATKSPKTRLSPVHLGRWGATRNGMKTRSSLIPIAGLRNSKKAAQVCFSSLWGWRTSLHRQATFHDWGPTHFGDNCPTISAFNYTRFSLWTRSFVNVAY